MEDWEKQYRFRQGVCTRLVRWLPCIIMLVLCLWRMGIHRSTVAKDATDTVVEYRTRTAVKVDTVFISPPIAPLLVMQLPSDTIRIEEPTTLHRVQATYEDSLYHAVVSGYIDARLDSLTIYPRNKTEIVEKFITIAPKRKRWGLGVQAGYGIGGFYAGVGVSYNLFQW